MSVILVCPKHPRYKAMRYPSSGCETCVRMWGLVAAFRELKRYCIRWGNR